MKYASLLFFASFIFCSWAFADRLKAVNGKVVEQSAIVYSRPDFDSEVVDTLRMGSKIPVSTKQFVGTGGMGLFHRVKTSSGKLGYVADTDLALPKGTKLDAPKGALTRKPPSKNRPLDQPEHVERDESIGKMPIYTTRYIGGSAAMINYTEKFQGEKLSSQIPFIGFRMTGPNLLFPSPPMDFNIQVSPFAPKYLNDFATSASGFVALMDLAMSMPLYQSMNSLASYSVGLMTTVSNYKAEVRSKSYDSLDVRFGIDIGVGYAYRFSKYAIRGDVKFYIEKTYYLGAMLSFQTEY